MLLLIPGSLYKRAPEDLKAPLRRTHVTALLQPRRVGTVSVSGLAPSIFQACDLDQ